MEFSKIKDSLSHLKEWFDLGLINENEFISSKSVVLKTLSPFAPNLTESSPKSPLNSASSPHHPLSFHLQPQQLILNQSNNCYETNYTTRSPLTLFS